MYCRSRYQCERNRVRAVHVTKHDSVVNYQGGVPCANENMQIHVHSAAYLNFLFSTAVRLYSLVLIHLKLA